MHAIGRAAGSPLVPRLALGLGGLTTSALGTIAFPTLAPFERAAFHLGTVEVGALTALIYLGAVGASFPAGRLTDALGAARTLALGQGTIMAGLALAAVAPSRAVFLAGVVVAGLGYGAVNPSTNVIATSRISRRRRGVFMGAKQTGATAGGLLTGAVLPGAAAAVGWRAAMVIPILAGAVTVLSSMWWARTHPGGAANRPETLGDDDGPAGPAPRPVWRALYSFVMAGVQFSFIAYLAVYLVDHEHYSSTVAGFGLALLFGAACVSRVAWGMVSDVWFSSRVTTLVLTSLGAGAGLALIALDSGGLLLWLGIALVGVFGLGWNGVFLAMVVDAAPPRVMGSASGAALVFINGGVVVLPLLFGVVRDASGSWPVTWICAAAAVTFVGVALGGAARRARVTVAAG